MICPDCKSNTYQFMADWIDELIKRYYKCKKCNHIIVEYVYAPMDVDKISVDGYHRGEVFKTEIIKPKIKTYQSTLF